MARKKKTYAFGKRSRQNLDEAHPYLQEIFNEVIKIIDCAVIEGHRDREEQNKLYDIGQSKLRWPRSKHNTSPSLAVDVIPYPVDWNDWDRFYFLAGIVKGVAFKLGYKIRWGGDWDSDNHFDDQSFHDLPHFELVGVRRGTNAK